MKRVTTHVVLGRLVLDVSIHTRVKRVTQQEPRMLVHYAVSIHTRVKRVTLVQYLLQRAVQVSIHTRVKRVTVGERPVKPFTEFQSTPA